MISLGVILVFAAGIFLAFSNGANDNIKGVATLLGSRTANYRLAMAWATITTLVGSLAAVFLAQKLMHNFSGKGLVPDYIAQVSYFSGSVAMAAALTVFLATRLGFPISTTHALTGGMVGAGLFASPEGIHYSKLLSTFFLPLIISPFLAVLFAVSFYPIFKFIKKYFGVRRESCVCLGREVLATAPTGLAHGAASAILKLESMPSVSFGTKLTCEERYLGSVWGMSAKTILDLAHFLSSGLVSFARGLNDTPKIAAILLVGSSLSAWTSLSLVGVVIALGGILMARRIANTMSYKITQMNDGQGFTANLVTSGIVIGASQLGVPVSTTHVSCGALFGIGTVTKQAHWNMVFKIILAWVITLPVAGALGAACFALLKEIMA